eukprot:scaffold91605_cov36-Prasinocladus_malaysianus.AAC.1
MARALSCTNDVAGLIGPRSHTHIYIATPRLCQPLDANLWAVDGLGPLLGGSDSPHGGRSGGAARRGGRAAKVAAAQASRGLGAQGSGARSHVWSRRKKSLQRREDAK